MKINITTVIFILSIGVSISVFGQGSGREGGWNSPPGTERLERFRKMRLEEALKLNEDDSVRFFAKQTAHEDKARELMKSRNDIVDDMDTAVRNHDEQKKLMDFPINLWLSTRRYSRNVSGFKMMYVRCSRRNSLENFSCLKEISADKLGMLLKKCIRMDNNDKIVDVF